MQFASHQVQPFVARHGGEIGSLGVYSLHRSEVGLLPQRGHVCGLEGSEDGGERLALRGLPLHALPKAEGKPVLVGRLIVELHLRGLLQEVGNGGVAQPSGGVAGVGDKYVMYARVRLGEGGGAIVLHHEVCPQLPFLAAVGEIYGGR